MLKVCISVATSGLISLSICWAASVFVNPTCSGLKKSLKNQNENHKARTCSCWLIPPHRSRREWVSQCHNGTASRQWLSPHRLAQSLQRWSRGFSTMLVTRHVWIGSTHLIIFNNAHSFQRHEATVRIGIHYFLTMRKQQERTFYCAPQTCFVFSPCKTSAQRLYLVVLSVLRLLHGDSPVLLAMMSLT